jgi:hypothetical protein
MLYKLEEVLRRSLGRVLNARSTESLLGTRGSSRAMLSVMRTALLPQFISVKILWSVRLPANGALAFLRKI